MRYLSIASGGGIEYCTSGKFYCNEGGAVHPSRNLNTFVLLFGLSGEYRIWQDGTEYALLPGTFLILLAGHDHHGTSPCAPGLSHYWCHFAMPDSYELMSETEAEETIQGLRTTQSTYNFTGLNRPKRLILPEYGRVSSTEKYRLLFHSLIDRSRSMHTYRTSLCDSIIFQLLCELSGDFISTNEDIGAQNRKALTEKAVEFIRTHATEISDVSTVAEHFGYNAEYLTTLLKKSTGLSIVEHINRSKIEEAKKLLLSSDLTISEIAPICGFNDVKYFSKLFHRLTETTPREYRNAYCRLHTNE